jgi:hypothetical protein
MTIQKLREQNFSVQWCSVPINWIPERATIPQPQSNTWVQLLEPESFSPLCHDEALLLCQISNWEWAAWIPDHGEAVINIEQFCFPTS